MSLDDAVDELEEDIKGSDEKKSMGEILSESEGTPVDKDESVDEG